MVQRCELLDRGFRFASVYAKECIVSSQSKNTERSQRRRFILHRLHGGTPCPCLKLRCAGGVVSSIPTGAINYSRMSFSSDQVTGTVFSSEHAFPSKF